MTCQRLSVYQDVHYTDHTFQALFFSEIVRVLISSKKEVVGNRIWQKKSEKWWEADIALLKSPPEPWIGVQLAKDVGVSDLTQEGVNFWKWVSLCIYTFIQFG